MVRRNGRYVIRRENNVLEVDFSREPDPPAPRFPGASGLRELPGGGSEPDWSFGELSWALDGRKSPAIRGVKRPWKTAPMAESSKNFHVARGGLP
jgi:hypothetical protein